MTRVTQSMLSNNMLRNLNTSFGKMSKLQDQINTGRKFTRPSQDPVAAVKGMQYRTQLDKIGQFQRNMNEAESWLDTSDVALGQVGDVLNRVKELVVQAANDTNTPDDRRKMAVEIEQIRQQVQDVANTKVGGKFIFAGTKTMTQPFVNGAINTNLTSSPGVLNAAATAEVKVEVFDNIEFTINTNNALGVFTNVDKLLTDIKTELDNANANGGTIGNFLGSIANGSNSTIADLQGVVLDARSEIGAKMNRVDLMINRLDMHEINVTKQKSENEDTDYAKAISEMTTAESIHQAALSVGSKIIQQTLVDFIR